MSDLLGNNNEEAVKSFIEKFDQDDNLGPHPIKGSSYSLSSISDTLQCSDEIAQSLFTKPKPFKYNKFNQGYLKVEIVT